MYLPSLTTLTVLSAETLYATKISSEPEQLIQVGQKAEAGQEILKEVSTFLQNKVSKLYLNRHLIQQKLNQSKKLLQCGSLLPMVHQVHVVSRKSVEEPEREFIPLGGHKPAVDEPKRESTQTVFSYKKSEVKEISLTIEKPSIEDMLLEYVRKSNGEIDLTRCSSELKTSNAEIEKALESLGNKGRIKIELRSPE